MPSSFFSTVAAKAKAHHQSLNSAYSTYYAPGFTPSTSPSASRNPSAAAITMPATQHDKPKAPTNASRAWNAIKQHRREMNEAYRVYYSPGVSSTNSSPASSAHSSPKTSSDEPRHESEIAGRSNGEKVWRAVKSRAVEHHKSVNAAVARTYAMGMK